MMLYRVVVVRFDVDLKKHKNGIYDVRAGDFNKAAAMAIEKAKADPTYAPLITPDDRLEADSIKVLEYE